MFFLSLWNQLCYSGGQKQAHSWRQRGRKRGQCFCTVLGVCRDRWTLRLPIKFCGGGQLMRSYGRFWFIFSATSMDLPVMKSRSNPNHSCASLKQAILRLCWCFGIMCFSQAVYVYAGVSSPPKYYFTSNLCVGVCAWVRVCGDVCVYKQYRF